MTRGPLSVSGQPDALVIGTPISGTFEALGTITGGVNAIGGAIGNLLGGSVGEQVQSLTGKAFDQRADIHGTVTATARPTIAPNWRLSPNLTAQVNVVDVVLPIAGIKLSVSNEVKPLLDNVVREQTNAMDARLRNDPFIERAARSEWSKLCRSIPLGAAGQGMPGLWLEVRPVRAIAAQPKIEANTVTLLIGVQAQTRIVPTETKPDCPFPQAARPRAAGQRGHARHRRSDRCAVHRGEPTDRRAVQGQDFSRRMAPALSRATIKQVAVTAFRRPAC